MHTPHDLSREDCSRLLKAGVAGRVAVGTPTGPHIVPVNYAVDGESILIRTTAYSLLGTYGRGALLCFEVDQFDYELKRGWSVVVRGRGELRRRPGRARGDRPVLGTAPLGDRAAQPRRPHPVDRGDRPPARRRLGPVAAPPRAPARLTAHWCA